MARRHKWGLVRSYASLVLYLRTWFASVKHLSTREGLYRSMGSSGRVYFLNIYCSVSNFCILVNLLGNAKYGASLHFLWSGFCCEGHKSHLGFDVHVQHLYISIVISHSYWMFLIQALAVYQHYMLTQGDWRDLRGHNTCLTLTMSIFFCIVLQALYVLFFFFGQEFCDLSHKYNRFHGCWCCCVPTVVGITFSCPHLPVIILVLPVILLFY